MFSKYLFKDFKYLYDTQERCAPLQKYKTKIRYNKYIHTGGERWL